MSKLTAMSRNKPIAAFVTLLLAFYLAYAPSFAQWTVSAARTKEKPRRNLAGNALAEPAAVQDIPLTFGWNMISSYIVPANPQLASLLAGIAPDLVLLKNGQGQVYWPALGIDGIDQWNPDHGYQVYMTAPAVLSISGDPVPLPEPLLPLPGGWSLIATHQSSDVPVAEAFSFLGPELYIVVNGLGAVFWPAYEVDQIDLVQPGQGYRVYLSAANFSNSPPRIVSGQIGFTKTLIDSDAPYTRSVTAVDLDRDGDIDVAAPDSLYGIINWYENDGNGNFTESRLGRAVDGAYPIHSADVDGDGHADVLAGGYLGDNFVWYRNNGGGSFTEYTIDDATDGAHSIVTGDMDGDNDIDLLASSQDANRIAWYENDGSQNFTRHIIDSAADTAKRAEFADIDGDGDQDALTASWGSDEIAWYKNDGRQNFTKQVISANANGAYYAVAADVDGDDDLDVFSANMVAGVIAWYENKGASGFTAHTVDNNASGARTVLAVDIDQDGHIDALAASVNDNTVAWHENNGSGVFTKHLIDTAVLGAYGVFAIDIDFDGDIDVLSASRDGHQVGLHTHIRTHSATVVKGGTLLINAARLLTEDEDDGPAELIYTLSAAPQRGVLRLDGAPLSAGGTFTQEEINNGRLSYVNNGLNTTNDAFTFTVADGGESGVRPAGGHFAIIVTN